MLPLEAAELAKLLTQFPADSLSPCLNLGSGTRNFREQQQPYIQRLLFEPLQRHGVRVIHSDLKAGEEITGLFPDFLLRYQQVASDGSFREQLRKAPGGLGVGLARWALRLASPFYRPNAWLSYVHSTLWLWRDYKVSLAILQKT